MATVEINPITRIEGDGRLILDVYTDANGKLRVTNLLQETEDGTFTTIDDATRYPKYCVTEFRGFEKFVEGEQPETVTKLVPRICGVCPVPHSMASAMAIEDAYGIAIPANAKAIRRFMLALHTIHSHLLHLFLLGGRDYLNHDVIAVELPNIINTHNKVQTCVAMLGGRPVHPASIMPGGQTKVPSLDELTTIKNYIQSVYDYVFVTLYPTIKDALLALPNDFGIRPANYVSSGIPFYTGLTTSYTYDGSSGGVILNGAYDPATFDINTANIVPFDLANIAEHEITPYGSTVDFLGYYSYSKRPYYVYNGVNWICEVGPLARLAVAYRAGDTTVRTYVDNYAADFGLTANDILAPTTRNRYIARLIETDILLDKVLGEWADAIDPTADAYIPPTPADGSGIGVIEAPRGTLIHTIDIVAGVTSAYNCIVPTTINSGAIEEAMVDNLVEIRPETEALLTTDEASALAAGDNALKYLLGDACRTVRGFDPCCSCSSHLIIFRVTFF